MYIGVDYYPEHWPKERWPVDARLMRQAGFNVVRLAEFAWVNLEPDEGRFDFAWLDEALAILYRQGVSAILCTPTAVMPAWLARKHPEAMATQKDGTRLVWGVRKENCFTVPSYRRLSERITRAMAEHFARTPNVIGWQTDNEFGGHDNVCYCDTCRKEFQDWLRRRYGTIAELNRAWGTHFWGHRLRLWSEVQMPRNERHNNPGACLDWKRFYSWLNVRFQHDQVRILRQVCPKHFVTHNFMGLFKELDYYRLAEDLDFVSWDNYPLTHNAPEVRYDASLAADIMRGLKRQNFWIMEQTAGLTGWGSFGRNPRPGEIRSIAYQQLAHGADGQIWFRWRTCTAGREQYWHGLLGHDGRPLRRYREAARTAKEYRTLEKLLAGTTVKADVAIVYDYESIWATQIQPGFPRNDAQNAVRRYYRALFQAGVNVDIVPPDGDLAAYKLVLTPDLYLLPDRIAERLNAYVKRGGILLADCRTGVKDETSLCHDRTLPGKLSPMLGIEIEEYESLGDGLKYAISGTEGFPGQFTAIQYVDWLTPTKAAPLAGYTQRHMASFAALTRHRFGKGVGWYLGAVVEEPAFYDQLIARLLIEARVQPRVVPPAGVEVSVRQGGGRELLFLLNHTEETRTIPVPRGKRELLTGKRTPEAIDLGPFDVAVVRLR
jgi:beta-galactosidase